MTKQFIGAVASLMISFASVGQSCDCTANLQWVKKTFEENDAGFQYVIDQKGRDAYESHHNRIALKAAGTNTLAECQLLIKEWGSFFRKGHFSFGILRNAAPQPALPNTAIIDQQEVLMIDSLAFARRIATQKQPNPEGIWVAEPYTVGIAKTSYGYVGFIMNAPGTAWKKNQVKFKIYQNGKNSTADLYLRDFSLQTHQRVELIGNNLINIGDRFYLKRKSGHFADSKSTKDYIRYLFTATPYFQKRSDKTAYIRIPAFDLEYKKLIDSVIHAHYTTISNIPNLIIDLRNNGGGADASFEKLMPFIYTNPIRSVSVQLLSTELNNKPMLEYSKNTDFDAETRKWFADSYTKLQQHPGKFVDIFDSVVSVEKLAAVLPQPTNVAIIINERNASTTEQFLLAAKQSKKVKLFGTTTFGALDISNMNYVPSPDGNFELGYCRSKSYRIPQMAIDDKGIMPDYYLDNAIPHEKWIDYVQEILEN